MPFGLKLLTIITVLAIPGGTKQLLSISTTISEFGIIFTLLNISSYILLIVFLYIVFSKSRKWWKIYLIWSVISVTFSLLNFIGNSIADQTVFMPEMIVLTLFMFGLAGLILLYIYKKKEYFNKK